MSKTELQQELNQLERDWMEKKILFRTEYKLLNEKKYPITSEYIQYKNRLSFYGTLFIGILPLGIISIIVAKGQLQSEYLFVIGLVVIAVFAIFLLSYFKHDWNTGVQKHLREVEIFEQAKEELLKKISRF